MRGSAVVAALLVVAIGGCPAEARVKAGPGVNPGWHKLGAATGSALDQFTTPTAAYSFRKLKSTYAGSAVRLRRASDNAEADIGFVGFVPGLGSPFDVAAANAHCAATSCFIAKWYDQGGAVRDVVQATAGFQPSLIFNCNGSLPCMRTTAATTVLATVGNFTPSAVATLSGVARRTAAAGNCLILNTDTNNFLYIDPSANWYVVGTTGPIGVAGVSGAWGAGVGVINGASSAIRLNAVETPGSVTGATAANTIKAPTGTSTPCDFAEAVLWDNYALTLAERTALTANQRSFWGF